jgi:hypothetical protein
MRGLGPGYVISPNTPDFQIILIDLARQSDTRITSSELTFKPKEDLKTGSGRVNFEIRKEGTSFEVKFQRLKTKKR